MNNTDQKLINGLAANPNFTTSSDFATLEEFLAATLD